MKFNEKIKVLRIKNNMTQQELGNKLNVSTVTIRNWESGAKQPSMQALIALSNVFETSSDYLLGLSKADNTVAPMTRSESTLLLHYRSLDKYGRKIVNSVCELEAKRVSEARISEDEIVVNYIRKFNAPAAAGYSCPIEGEDYELIPVNSNIPRSADFAVNIQGDSMSPYINDNDTVYVKRTDEKLNIGDVGIFCVDGCTYCKIYYEDNKGNVVLVSANPDLKDSNVTISYDSGRSLVCFGKVLLKKQIPLPDYFDE